MKAIPTAISMPVSLTSDGPRVGMVDTRREEGRAKMSMAPEDRALGVARRMGLWAGIFGGDDDDVPVEGVAVVVGVRSACCGASKGSRSEALALLPLRPFVDGEANTP